MADKNKQNGNEIVLMIEGLYNGIAYDLQKMKKEITNELKYSSMQVSSSYEALQNDNKATAEAVDGTANVVKEQAGVVIDSVKKDVEALKKVLDEYVANASKSGEDNANIMATELKYGYQQNQMIFEALEDILKNEVLEKIATVEGKVEVLETIDAVVNEINEKIAAIGEPVEPDYEAISETVKEKVIGALPVAEEIDYDRITESVAEKTEASVAVHSKEVIDAVAAIPVAENVDYTRIVEEVSEKVFEKITEYYSDEKLNGFVPVIPEKADDVDYDRIVYGTAEKVVESLPYPQKINEEAFIDKIADAVIAKLPVPEAIDYDALADAVIAKMPAPVQPEPIDYDALADAVVAKMPVPETTDYEAIAALVASKIVIPETEAPVYDIVVDEEGAQMIADKVVVPAAEKTEIDYTVLANEITEKMPQPAYEMIIDENGAEMIAQAVAEKLKGYQPVEETVEEVQEEPVQEEVVEEVQEEPVQEEVVEEVQQEPVQEEIAATETPAEIDYDDANQLVDAENGLVVRLKRSFEAKLRQSTPEIKAYYSQIKNELNSYKRLNSNLSWHGDRFNFGRDTVARMNISGKTLCFYVALDPANPEFKTTVYHQKDLSSQKAYENTPFMIKIKSETAAKRAVKLVGFLATKLEAVKNEKYEVVDFVEEFGYASTKELIDAGLIKVTKEKKVALNFN